MVDTPKQDNASQGVGPEELSSVGLRLIRATEATFQEICGKKPISLRDIKALLTLIQGDKTRQEIEATTGLTARAAQKAIERLRDEFRLVKTHAQSGAVHAQSGAVHAQSGAPLYGLIKRDNISIFLLKYLKIDDERAQSGAGVYAPSLSLLKKNNKEEPQHGTGVVLKNPTAPNTENLTAPGKGILTPGESGQIPLPDFLTADHVAQQFKGLTVSGELDKRQLVQFRKNRTLLLEKETRLFHSMFPGYYKELLDPLERNARFIQAYLKIQNEKVGPMPAPTAQGDPVWHGNMILARHRADSMGAPYELFIEAVRQKYENLNIEKPEKFKISFPQPNHLKTEKAAEAYRGFVLEVNGDHFRRALPFLMEPTYTPADFDPFDPAQRHYYQWVWGHIKGSREKGEHEGHLLVMAIEGRQRRQVLPVAILESEVLKLADYDIQRAVDELERNERARQQRQLEEEELARERLAIAEASGQSDQGITSPIPPCFGQGPDMKTKRCLACDPWKGCVKVRQEERKKLSGLPAAGQVLPLKAEQKGQQSLKTNHERQPSQGNWGGPCTTMTREELDKQLRISLGLDSDEKPSSTVSPTEEGHHD
ncbi:MAG: hypothetical protein K9K65_08840 [Desulfarculaceae bacterium]|nr:hypothetical protein [Desulfarculaceae bacterium]MCF8045911.1 hypothetical protein [Desulfarculaceae bacterium]MCF8097933.1 hypothetical protein [Desulfarculaceae bacterium]MCF8121114.1 hypothetical protein [Desulfarculaceae bacterium]